MSSDAMEWSSIAAKLADMTQDFREVEEISARSSATRQDWRMAPERRPETADDDEGVIRERRWSQEGRQASVRGLRGSIVAGCRERARERIVSEIPDCQ